MVEASCGMILWGSCSSPSAKLGGAGCLFKLANIVLFSVFSTPPSGLTLPSSIEGVRLIDLSDATTDNTLFVKNKNLYSLLQ